MIERRSHRLFILLAGIAALLGAYVLGRISAPSTIEREGGLISEDGRRPGALKRGAHRPRAAALKAAIRSQHGSAGEDTVGPLESDQPRTSGERDGEELDSIDVRKPLEPEEEERSLHEARIAFWDKLSARVDAEPPDPTWRRETEPVITRVIPEQLGPQVSVHDVVCASSLCRAKLTHPEWPRIPNDKFLQFSLNRGSLGPMEIQLDTREKGATVLFFLRREHAPAEYEL
ncbi:hypothetical protein [Sorangium sp. So ce124]|uniref:hypothetical protein n=1 Tax=Sorangium sp. So ce124 TaxID=3133280 RepID=UPI003F623F64